MIAPKKLPPFFIPRSPRGFALIVTLALMMLLALVAVGLLTLSTVAARGGNRDVSIARANARMALMLAIGQLQRATGPDQRVTAAAAILDSDPLTPTIENVKNPGLIGAWKTVWGSNDAPIIEQINKNSNNAGDDQYHIDHRKPSGSLDHRGEVEWLVSQTPSSNFNAAFTELNPTGGQGGGAVFLDSNSQGQIAAPLVSISGGRYAYTVSDLGAAAPVVQHNPVVSQEPDSGRSGSPGYANLYIGKKRPYGDIPETSIALDHLSTDDVVADPENASRRATLAMAGFQDNGIYKDEYKSLLKTHGNEFVATNSALFTDTLNGGLKIDLTPYLRDTSNPGLGQLTAADGSTILSDLTPLVPGLRYQSFSPKFGALRDYARLGDIAGAGRSMIPRAPLIGGGSEKVYADPLKVVKQGVHPVITEFSSYISVAPDPNAQAGVSLIYYPRVTLWNPHNVAIEPSYYLFQPNQSFYYNIDIREKTGAQKRYAYALSTMYWTDANRKIAGDGTYALNNCPVFPLAKVRIEPGQSIVFSPPNGVIRPLGAESRNDNLNNYMLVPDADISQPDRGGFFRACQFDSLKEKFNEAKHSAEFAISRVEGSEQWARNNACLRIIPGNTIPSYAQIAAGQHGQEPRYPVVHSLDLGGRITELQYTRVIPNPPVWTPMSRMDFSQPGHPHNRSKTGGRLKAISETAANLTVHPNAMWNYPLFEAANLRAPIFRRTPWDSPIVSRTKSVAPDTGSRECIAFGPITSEEIEEPEYLDAFMLPRMNDVAEGSPFMNAQSDQTDLRYAVFDVPPAGVPIFNFAQFRSATLTQEFSAPTFIVGESLATPAAPRDQSAYSVAQYKTDWWNGLNKKNVTNTATRGGTTLFQCAWWQPEYDPDASYAAYDYRYESNLALWDRFYCSTLPAGAPLSTFTEPGSLPNHHIHTVHTSGRDLTNPTEAAADHAARHLRLRNHLSVNSTNKLAWMALLSANRGLNIAGKTTGNEATPFPGSSAPSGDGGTAADSQSAEAWSGYRELKPAELESLVDELLVEIKRRAPFISLSDFVNRRLAPAGDLSTSPAVAAQSAEDLLSYGGPLEIAIRKAGLNSAFRDFPVKSAADYAVSTNPAPPTPTKNLPEEAFAGAPGFLSQAKILQTIGSLLTARSDTFRIVAYGEATDRAGNITARVVCECIVQRTTEFVDSTNDENSTLDTLTPVNRKFGRRYKVESFQWLNSSSL